MGFWLLEDVGILQYILDFLLYHDPIIEPYNPRKCVGHGELVFAYERETSQLRGLMPKVITCNAAISACEKGPSHKRHCIW